MTKVENAAFIDDVLDGNYCPAAVYYPDSDCVEYVKSDGFFLYDRIDQFLTLVLDSDSRQVVGFKLKGFRNIFESRLKYVQKLHDSAFFDLVKVIEIVFTDIGNEVFDDKDDRRQDAYKSAVLIAANDNVIIDAAMLVAA
jgi:hypothetical protein